MKMKIGVILRPVSNRYTLNLELEEVISYYGGTTIGFTKYDPSLLDTLDGVILQGGEDYTPEDLKIVSYLYEKNIPTLGICLGMQTMSVFKNGCLYEVKNHHQEKKPYVHKVVVDKNSYFYSLISEEMFFVNSRHHEAVYVTSLDIVGKSEDNIIEVVEDKNKLFFIGIQWHPETNFEHDFISRRIFDAYFYIVQNRNISTLY
jgi:gamma-glutamyl-gamma-aminobutyrate hydrolase PuuD